MSVKKDWQSSLAMEAELNKERAGALGRTARTLETHLDKCAQLAKQLELAASDARARLLAEYREEYALALKWRWYLCIQREAMGLRRHDDVDRIYPPPKNIKE